MVYTLKPFCGTVFKITFCNKDRKLIKYIFQFLSQGQMGQVGYKGDQGVQGIPGQKGPMVCWIYMNISLFL